VHNKFPNAMQITRVAMLLFCVRDCNGNPTAVRWKRPLRSRPNFQKRKFVVPPLVGLVWDYTIASKGVHFPGCFLCWKIVWVA